MSSNDKKTILLIPSSFYLSDEVFTKISKNPNYKYIYLNPSEGSFHKINTKHKVDIKSKVDQYIQLPKDIYFGANPILKFASYTLKKLQIIFVLFKTHPDIIITTADGTFTSRIVGRFFQKIPFVILQTTLLTVYADKYKPVHRGWFFKCIWALFGDILFPFFDSVKPFGLNHPYGRIFIWGDSTQKLLQPLIGEQQLKIVGNPLFENRPEAGFATNKVLILGPHVATTDEIHEFCSDVCRIVDNFPEMTFYIRLHPIMNRDIFQNNFQKLNRKNIELISEMESLNESILRVNLVISQFSVATLDALALKRYVILYKKIFEDRLCYWFQSMDIPKLKKMQSVIDCVETLKAQGVFEGHMKNETSVSEHWWKYGEAAQTEVISGIDQIVKESTNS